MQNVIPYYKPLGLTPLQAIEKLKSERPELANVPITYAGRLDPMAEGLLILLTGDAVHRKQEFLDLPKTYEAKILLGFSSDTFDILGLASLQQSKLQHKNPQELITAVKNLVGTHNFSYPPYSSKTVDGKPLWLLTREGKISAEELPKREMTVLAAENIEIQDTPWQKIYTDITTTISLVNGDFRQSEILDCWSKINDTTSSDKEFQVISVKFTVSSGTYIRTLAHELGGLLLHLKRTSIGEYHL